MGQKDDKLYILDRNGGREKILRVTYAPRSHRRVNTAARVKSKWTLAIAILVGAIIGTVIYQLM